jgi:hypothetical protein
LRADDDGHRAKLSATGGLQRLEQFAARATDLAKLIVHDKGRREGHRRSTPRR